MLREAVILRAIKVRLLVSCSKQTHPLTFNFVWSLKTLCMELANCSLQVVSVSKSYWGLCVLVVTPLPTRDTFRQSSQGVQLVLVHSGP